MADEIRFQRGPENRLPLLDNGEPAITTDTNKLFFGSPSGNVEVANKQYVDGLPERVATVETSLTGKADKTTVDTEFEKRGVNVLWYEHLKVGDDWAPAFQAAITRAKELGLKVIVPSAEYTVAQSILIDFITLTGDETSVFSTSSKGTVIRALTKDFPVFKQNSLTAAALTFEISNLIIKDADVGLELTYVVNSSFKNIYLDGCNTALVFGKSTAAGSLFCTFDNIYTRNCIKGLEINGKDFVNNNVFINCYFSGSEYAASIDCNGGLGAVSNQFIACEFQSSEGRGVILNNARNTTFLNPYLECKGNAIRFKNTTATTIIQPTLGSLKNTNSLGDTAFFHLEQAASITLMGGCTYLIPGDDTTGLYQFSSALDSDMIRVRIVNNIRHLSYAVPFHATSILNLGTVVRGNDGFDWHLTVNTSTGAVSAVKLV